MTETNTEYGTTRRLLDLFVLSGVRLWATLRYPRLSRAYANMSGERSLPNAAVPKTANEKFLWRKLFDHDPRFTRLSDKIEARAWLAENGFDARLPKLIWTGTDAADIPDEALRGGVAVKGAHGYDMNIFLPEAPADREAFNARANAFMKQSHGRVDRQWGYYDVPHRLIVEELLPGAMGDLKVYTFGARIKRLVAIYDRFSDISADVWRTGRDDRLTLSDRPAVIGETMAGRPLPPFMDEAFAFCEAIGAHFDHMRVDLLSDGERFWMGELTVYNLGGNFDGVSDEDKRELARAWDIRKSWFLTSPHSGWRETYRRALLRHLNGQNQREMQ